MSEEVESGDRRPCSHCGELTTPLPEDLHGLYDTRDGRTMPATGDDYLHRECAELAIEMVEIGEKQPTLTEATKQ